MNSEDSEGLVPAIRASLNAKLERLLRQPLIARVVRPAPPTTTSSPLDRLPDMFQALDSAIGDATPKLSAGRKQKVWREDPDDGTCSVSIEFDYEDLWRGRERDVLEAVEGTVEDFVTFLTDEQRLLLERAPRELLALNPRPECAELVAFTKEFVGGADRVQELVLAEPPKSPGHIRFIAIIPNLVPLERQLAALSAIEQAAPDGPLAPLRALLGLSHELTEAGGPHGDAPKAIPKLKDRLDAFQKECVHKALDTPHFAVIQGPPGSGKTTVISTVIRHALDRGGRVLVVSPTHVAVDNVVEKLTPTAGDKAPDDLECRTLPVRFAARPKRLLEVAAKYWIGPKRERRAATLTQRVQRRLSETDPVAKALFARLDKDAAGQAPLSQAVARVQRVICGTPIGILSFDAVKSAADASFDLLVVDEVSKMTLPEFLAVAVKARRWVLVGDPQQLPPYCDAEENGATLEDLLPPQLELVCSVVAYLERRRPYERQDTRLAVICLDPKRVVAGVRAQLLEVSLDGTLPPIHVYGESMGSGVVACTVDQLPKVVELLSPAHDRDRTRSPRHTGSVEVLVERSVRLPRPQLGSGARLVEPRLSAPSRIFDTVFSVYHAQPWQRDAEQKLVPVQFRHGLNKYLPSAAALELNGWGDRSYGLSIDRDALLDAIAARFAVNVVSVYDWLTGLPVEHFDVAPMQNLRKIEAPLEPLRAAVAPYVGTLRKQYRMHASISKVPRELFYFGKALEDGLKSSPGSRVRLVQVHNEGPPAEFNQSEVREICQLLSRLNTSGARSEGPRQRILVITPYRAQERELAQGIGALRREEPLDHIDVEVCTLDRCQGREAEYVFISLVRNRSTPFLDAPKRWNVALTRAIQGMAILGDIDNYLREANKARRFIRNNPHKGKVLMSLLARILESYDQQIAAQAPR